MGILEHAIEVIALVLLAIGGRAAFLYCRPMRECRRCRKGGLIGGSFLAAMLGHTPKRKRRRACRRCGNTQVTRRWGAKHIHKTKLSLIQAWDERGLD